TPDAVEALSAFISIPGEKTVDLSWEAVQSKDGADADNKTATDITLTLKTYKALAKDFTVDGDLLIKTGDAEFNTEHEAVYTVAPGSDVDLEAMLAFSDVKDQLKALQDEILGKVPEDIKTSLGTTALQTMLDGVKLEGTESNFEAVFEIPEGLTAPSEPAAELTSDLYEVKNTAAEGTTLTVTMALKGEYPTFGDLRKAVEGAQDEMLLDIKGFTTEDAPDKTYTVKGTLTGSLNTTASVDSQAFAAVRNIKLSWEAVQKADGTDAVAGADSETIQLTIATFGALEKSYEVGGDLLVSKSGGSAFDTEHEKVFETTPGSVVDLEAMLAFSDVKAQLKEVQDEFLGKVPQGEALLDEVKLDGTESTFEAVFEIPEGLTLPSEPAAELKDCDLYEVKETAVDGNTLTVTMALKGEYPTFGDLRKAVEGAQDEMLLDIKGVTVGDADDQTYTVKGTLEGSLNTTASLVSSQLAVGKIITINWEAVQTEDGSDALLGSEGIQLSIHAAQPQLNKEDHFAYVIGYPDGTVKPEANITRAEVATIFFRLLTDQSRAQNWSKTNNFTDVKSTDWFNNAVSTMSKAGIINGYPDKTFLPQNEITRAEFATIAARFDSSEPDTSGSKLTDIAGHWAEKYIKKAEALGYVTGYEDGSFKPDQPITRAEAMTLINRVLERMDNNIGVDGLLPEAEMNTWTDNMNKSAWYYTAVQEATNSHTYDNKQIVPDDKINHYTETWVEKIADPDWAALEKEWSKANDE
ncbi:MAG: S-layer homology domain-containing protein, partial [Firmicutes bacterium]|nr:S-layer homology domain-containing protein [Bacillota bacterium]